MRFASAFFVYSNESGPYRSRLCLLFGQEPVHPHFQQHRNDHAVQPRLAVLFLADLIPQ